MKPWPPLEEDPKPQVAEDKSSGPCFIRSKPVWAAALTEDLDFTLQSFSSPPWPCGIKPSRDYKNISVKPSVTMGVPTLSCRGRLCFHSHSFPQKTFNDYQHWAASIPGAGNPKIHVTVSAPKLLPMCGKGCREASMEHSRSTGGRVDQESNVRAKSSSVSKLNGAGTGGFLDQGGSPEYASVNTHIAMP